MTFQQLHYLLTVNRTGSVSLAAKELFVTQSTVSIAISSLESELDCRIFVRSTQGLTLTPEGKQIIGYAQRIYDNHRLLTTSVKPSKPHLRIGAIGYAPTRSAFMRLLDEHKDLTSVSFAFCKIAGYQEQLLRGNLDVAVNLSFSQYDEKTYDEAKKQKLQIEKLTTIPATICIGEGHRLFNKPDLKPEDFANDCLLEAEGKPISRASILLAYLPINPDRTLECYNANLADELRDAGYVYSITHLPPKYVREKQNFRYIPIPGLRYSLFVYTDAVRTPSQEALRYIELLKDEVAHTQM